MVNWTLAEGFLNSSGTTATIVKGLYDNVGGSWFATIMLIVLFVIIIAMLFRLPLEVTAVVLLPLFLACYVYVPDFAGVTGVLLIYLGILIGKNYFFK